MNKKRDWLIERVALGELDAKVLTEDERHQVEALKSDNEAILSAHAPEKIAAEIRRRARTVSAAPVRRSWMIALPLAAAASALAIVALSFDPVQTISGREPEVTRMKGDRALAIHLKSEGRTELLHANDAVKKGDLLQLAYGAGNAEYGIVLSIDGAGAVTLHLPAEKTAAALLEAQGAELPFSYELDAAPKFERFFLITAAASFDAEVALQAAKTLAADRDRAETAPLSLPRALSQTAVLLRKATTP